MENEISIPSVVKFVDGKYRDLVFKQGSGPSERRQVDGGRVMLFNSTNFWYVEGSQQLFVGAEYLRKNTGEWVVHS